MTRFWFAINVEVDASRHIAKKLQEVIWECLEGFPNSDRIIDWQGTGKLKGMTVKATTVKEIKREAKQ